MSFREQDAVKQAWSTEVGLLMHGAAAAPHGENWAQCHCMQCMSLCVFAANTRNLQ